MSDPDSRLRRRNRSYISGSKDIHLNGFVVRRSLLAHILAIDRQRIVAVSPLDTELHRCFYGDVLRHMRLVAALNDVRDAWVNEKNVIHAYSGSNLPLYSFLAIRVHGATIRTARTPRPARQEVQGSGIRKSNL